MGNLPIWAVILIALLIFTFCLWKTYTLGFGFGYKVGAQTVLDEWKKTLPEYDDK